MSKIITLAVAILLSFSTMARAQTVSAPTLTPAASDFQLIGSLDSVVNATTGSRAVFTTNALVSAGGWIFECRSGLQPQTQRIGVFSATYRFVGSDTVIPAGLFPVEIAARQDVAQAYQFECPAVGAHVGFNVNMFPPPVQGQWELKLTVTTTDGAGRPLEWSRTHIISFTL
jgi:hypothetical protein